MPELDAPFADEAPEPRFQEPAAATSTDSPAAAAAAAPGEDTEVSVEFDQTADEAIEISPPPMKRVQVSNQMDILAELEGLRKQATMDSRTKWSREDDREVDIESLLAGTDPVRELRERITSSLNSDIFKRMRGLEVSVRIHDGKGQTIHDLDPVRVSVGKASKLEKLTLRFLLDLENTQ
jgi:hypothetical protein